MRSTSRTAGWFGIPKPSAILSGAIPRAPARPRSPGSCLRMRRGGAASEPQGTPTHPTAVCPDKSAELESLHPPMQIGALCGRPAGRGFPVMVEARPPAGTRRTPSDICCVVDTSDSMGMAANVQNEGGETNHGLSVLDLVKHSLKTIAGNLTEGDRMAVVSYSSTATTVFPLASMTEGARSAANAAIARLAHGGSTNFWDGFRSGLELLRAAGGAGNFKHMLLFTDGKPDRNPPGGIIPSLRRLVAAEGGRLPCTVSTFGFGYGLDSELLSEFARIGSGSYNFIPDAGLVGTVLVNALSNLLVCAAENAQLVLTPLNGAEFAGGGALGGLPTTENQDGTLTVDLGQVQFGQPRQVLVQMSSAGGPPPGAEYLRAVLKYTRGGPTACEETFKRTDDFEAVEPQRLRVRFVDVCREAMGQTASRPRGPAGVGRVPPGARAEQAAAGMSAGQGLIKELADEMLAGQGLIKELADEIERSPARGEESVRALLEDVRGQVSEAFSRGDWYSKWGSHYLPSLMFAHLMQQCNNFKDAGVQFYGGGLFGTLRDEADRFFVGLPPPEPSAARLLGLRSSAASRPVNMSAYMDRHAGCVDGECMVRMADGSSRRVAELQKGDSVATPDGASAGVVCVVRTAAPNGKFLLAELPGGLRVTPHHPVRVDGAWRFPLDLAPAAEVDCRAVYTLVLEEVGPPAVGFIVNGVPCAPLGHGVEEGAARHPYLGSRRVVWDLRKFPGFGAGLVDLAPGSVVRDSETGLVCSLTAD